MFEINKILLKLDLHEDAWGNYHSKETTSVKGEAKIPVKREEIS